MLPILQKNNNPNEILSKFVASIIEENKIKIPTEEVI